MAAVLSMFRGSGPDISEAETAAENEVPTLASVSPEYAALAAKKAELHDRRERLRADWIALGREERERSSGGGSSAASGRPSSNRVAALAGLAPPPPPAVRSSELYDQITDLGEAIALLDDKLNDARNLASVIVRERVTPRYRRIVGKLADRLLELREAQRQYEEFADALNAEGVAWAALRPMPLVRMLGDPRDKTSPIALFVLEASEYDLIPRSALPEDLR